MGTASASSSSSPSVDAHVKASCLCDGASALADQNPNHDFGAPDSLEESWPCKAQWHQERCTGQGRTPARAKGHRGVLSDPVVNNAAYPNPRELLEGRIGPGVCKEVGCCRGLPTTAFPTECPVQNTMCRRPRQRPTSLPTPSPILPSNNSRNPLFRHRQIRKTTLGIKPDLEWLVPGEPLKSVNDAAGSLNGLR